MNAQKEEVGNKMKRYFKSFAGLVVLSSAVLSSQAATIDFEGVVASQFEYITDRTEGAPVVRSFGDFNVSVWEAVYLPDNYTPAELAPEKMVDVVYLHPSSGSANVVTQRLSVAHSAGTTFSITSVQIAKKANNVNVGTVSIRGYFEDGSPIDKVFDADQIEGFQTVTFDAAWTGLVKLDFMVDGGQMHFDNIEVN